MERYPDIQRQKGTLFFIPHGNRAAIAMSIERLIDLLDATDENPDDEDGGDLEPTHGWPNAGQRAVEAMCCDDEHEVDNADWEPSLGAQERHPHPWCGSAHGDQSLWAYGAADDREDDGDDLEPDHDAEYSYGWTGHLDQTKAMACEPHGCDGEGEPDMGWCGHGTGLHPTEPVNGHEANGDELDLNGDEGDYSPSEETMGFQVLAYDGSGAALAKSQLAGARPRLEPYGEIIGTRHHILQDGSVFTTLVPR